MFDVGSKTYRSGWRVYAVPLKYSCVRRNWMKPALMALQRLSPHQMPTCHHVLLMKWMDQCLLQLLWVAFPTHKCSQTSNENLWSSALRNAQFHRHTQASSKAADTSPCWHTRPHLPHLWDSSCLGRLWMDSRPPQDWRWYLRTLHPVRAVQVRNAWRKIMVSLKWMPEKWDLAGPCSMH